MNPDELKRAWKAQSTSARLTIDADILLRQLERDRQHFEATIFWRDFREIGLILLLVAYSLWKGISAKLAWSYFLPVPALLWVAGFLVADRIRQNRRQARPGDPLWDCLGRSLAQVEHQIRLLRNVFWWYLLPPGAAIAAYFLHTAWHTWTGHWPDVISTGIALAGLALIFWGVYWLNQYAVRRSLEPRRHDLRALVANLEEGGTGIAPSQPFKAEWRDWAAFVWFCVIWAIVIATVFWMVTDFLRKPEQGGSVPSEMNAAAFNADFRPAAGDAAVTNLLVPIRQKYRVPAIAAALVNNKGIVTVGVVGTRKQGTEIAATLDDQWHLGSDGKAMTATLVAKLVEAGRLKWDTTLAEVFPDLAPRFDPQVRTITVLQLLTHRSGLPPNPDLVKYGSADGRQERLRVVENELSKPLAHQPGTHYEYSNLGYAVVGAITEKITGKSWEQSMQEEVFGPLGMTSAGFGGTGTPGQIDQPWGHHANGQPVTGNGPAMDNPPVLGPAGRIHCTVQDWAKFIADQLRGDRGEPALLKPATYRFLHTPAFGGDYACGWLVAERDWAGGKALNHGGDNTMNCANVWVAPRRDFAMLVCINQSGPTAFKASDEVMGALIRLQTERTQPVKEPSH